MSNLGQTKIPLRLALEYDLHRVRGHLGSRNFAHRMLPLKRPGLDLAKLSLGNVELSRLPLV